MEKSQFWSRFLFFIFEIPWWTSQHQTATRTFSPQMTKISVNGNLPPPPPPPPRYWSLKVKGNSARLSFSRDMCLLKMSPPPGGIAMVLQHRYFIQKTLGTSTICSNRYGFDMHKLRPAVTIIILMLFETNHSWGLWLAYQNAAEARTHQNLAGRKRDKRWTRPSKNNQKSAITDFPEVVSPSVNERWNKNPFKKGCVWSRGMFRYQWDGLRILYSPAKWLRNQGQGSPLG